MVLELTLDKNSVINWIIPNQTFDAQKATARNTKFYSHCCLDSLPKLSMKQSESQQHIKLFSCSGDVFLHLKNWLCFENKTTL